MFGVYVIGNHNEIYSKGAKKKHKLCASIYIENMNQPKTYICLSQILHINWLSTQQTYKQAKKNRAAHEFRRITEQFTAFRMSVRKNWAKF